MKEFPFLLLDAGPIIKLFELGIWDKFIQKCDVTISRTVAEDEVVFAGKEYDKEYIDFGLKTWEGKGLIKIFEAEPSDVKVFYETHSLKGKYRIDPGEEEALTFLYKHSKDWKLCSADGPVFSVLGFLAKTEQGISLEEVLQAVGLSRELEWRYTKRFREKYTRMGQVDSIQDRGLL
jgi:hypothetical protein